MTQSWIITEKESGKAVFETYNKKTADAVNTQKYNVTPAMEYLCNLNAQIKKGVA
jgi:hypothetical protein